MEKLTYHDYEDYLRQFVDQTNVRVVVEALENICREKARAISPMSQAVGESWLRAAKQLEIVTHVLQV